MLPVGGEVVLEYHLWVAMGGCAVVAISPIPAGWWQWARGRDGGRVLVRGIVLDRRRNSRVVLGRDGRRLGCGARDPDSAAALPRRPPARCSGSRTAESVLTRKEAGCQAQAGPGAAVRVEPSGGGR